MSLDPDSQTEIIPQKRAAFEVSCVEYFQWNDFRTRNGKFTNSRVQSAWEHFNKTGSLPNYEDDE